MAYKRNSYWYTYVRYKVTGSDGRVYEGRVREKISTTKKEAEKAEAQLRAAIANGTFIPPQLRRVVVPVESTAPFAKFARDEFLPWSNTNHSPSHHKQQIRIVEKHLIPYFGKEMLAAITRKRCEDYVQMRSNDHYVHGKTRKAVKPATVNRELFCLKKIFVKAIDYGKLEVSPAVHIKPLPEVPDKARVLLDDEVVRLLDAMPDHLRALVATVVYAGLRRSEVFRLRWEDVNLKEGSIQVVSRPTGPTKNRRSRIVAMPPDLRRYLEQHPRRLGVKLVFPNRSKAGNPYYKIDKQLDEAAVLAGISEGKVRLHQLRHTYCTRAQLAGIDAATVQQWMGHKSIHTTQGYTSVPLEHQRFSASKLSYGTPAQAESGEEA